MRSDFPILQKCVYLDSAATSQKPRQVVERLSQFYLEENANIHRGVYELSEEATRMYEDARKKVAAYMNCEADEVVFVRNATEAINLVKYCLNVQKVLLTEMEHHANLVPWLDKDVSYIPLDGSELDYKAAAQIVEGKDLVSFTHTSNVLGTRNDCRKLVALAKEAGAYTLIDGAQGMAHERVDVQALDCDFFAFSGHKCLGPTGIGVLYIRREVMHALPPFMKGGDMIKEVSFAKASFAEGPSKFEAGTPHIAGAVGLGVALEYLEKVIDSQLERERKLHALVVSGLEKLGATIYSGGQGIVSFAIEGWNNHDLAALLGAQGVCVRSGHHCCMPLMEKLGVDGLVRVSFGVYTNEEDVQKFLSVLGGIVNVND